MSAAQMEKHLFNLKFASKQLLRDSKRCEKEEKVEKTKLKKAIEKGNIITIILFRIVKHIISETSTHNFNYLERRRTDCLMSWLSEELEITTQFSDGEHRNYYLH